MALAIFSDERRKRWTLAAVSFGLFALTDGPIEANEYGWSSARIVGSFAVAVVALAAFVVIERRRSPMLELSLSPQHVRGDEHRRRPIARQKRNVPGCGSGDVRRGKLPLGDSPRDVTLRLDHGSAVAAVAIRRGAPSHSNLASARCKLAAL